MKTTIDSAGRIVIPKKIREEAALKPGTPLEVSCRDGHLEIEPAPLAVRLVRRGRFLVAVPEADDPGVMTTEMVEAVRDSIHRERGERS